MKLESSRNHFRGFSMKVRFVRFLIIISEFSVKRFGLKKTLKLFNFFSRKHVSTLNAEEQEIQMDWCLTLVNVVKHLRLLNGRCLSQSIILWWLLKNKGIETEIMIGISMEGKIFESHAWLEKNGQLVNEHPSHIEGMKSIPMSFFIKKTKN